MKNIFGIHGSKLAAVVVLLMVFSCSLGSIRVRDYYLLSYTPVSTPPANSQRPYPYSLQVGRIEIQRIFNRQNILYRFSPNQIQYYEFEYWAVRPDYMITDMVVKHLETIGITNRVGMDFLETRPDFRIEGMVNALEKYDAGDLFFAHLAMSFKLFRSSDGRQIWDYTFDERKQIFQKEMVYTVQGLSAILQNQMDIIVDQLDSLFLSMISGQLGEGGRVIIPEPSSEKVIGQEMPSDGLDESEFEIIPEKR